MREEEPSLHAQLPPALLALLVRRAVPDPTAQHHREDHLEDLDRGREHCITFHSNSVTTSVYGRTDTAAGNTSWAMHEPRSIPVVWCGVWRMPSGWDRWYQTPEDQFMFPSPSEGFEGVVIHGPWGSVSLCLWRAMTRNLSWQNRWY
jgi:hypothetical protein